MWMKRAPFACKASLAAVSFQPLMKQSQPARRIINSDPENPRMTVWRKCTASANDYSKWRDPNRGILNCLCQRFDLHQGSVAEEFQGEMQILFAGPTCLGIWSYLAQMIDVRTYLL